VTKHFSGFNLKDGPLRLFTCVTFLRPPHALLFSSSQKCVDRRQQLSVFVGQHERLLRRQIRSFNPDGSTSQLCTIPSHTQEHHTDFFYYFGFGSNLLAERLRYRITGAEFVGIGVLQDYELGFGGYGNRWKGAAATIFKTVDEQVWGVVWKVPHSFSETLDEQESSYHRLHVPILMTSGETIDCRTYQMTDVTSGDHLPSPHYKHVIVSGAIEHKLPEHYIDKLKNMRDNGYIGHVFIDLTVLNELNSGQHTDSTDQH